MIPDDIVVLDVQSNKTTNKVRLGRDEELYVLEQLDAREYKNIYFSQEDFADLFDKDHDWETPSKWSWFGTNVLRAEMWWSASRKGDTRGFAVTDVEKAKTRLAEIRETLTNDAPKGRKQKK